MVMVLAPAVKVSVDVTKVLKMVIIHDLCEVYSGDHWAFKKKKLDKYDVEMIGLIKIVRNLPAKTRAEFVSLWEEYEAKETEEAKLAQAVDKMEVLIQHNEASLKTWNKKERWYNLIYGDEVCDYDLMIKQFKELIKKESQKKLIVQ